MANKQVYAWIFKHPGNAIDIYYKGGRKAAIHRFCVECVGSPQEARQCPCDDCPLWMFRPGATKGAVPSFVPSRDELLSMTNRGEN